MGGPVSSPNGPVRSRISAAPTRQPSFRSRHGERPDRNWSTRRSRHLFLLGRRWCGVRPDAPANPFDSQWLLSSETGSLDSKRKESPMRDSLPNPPIRLGGRLRRPKGWRGTRPLIGEEPEAMRAVADSRRAKSRIPLCIVLSLVAGGTATETAQPLSVRLSRRTGGRRPDLRSLVVTMRPVRYGASSNRL